MVVQGYHKEKEMVEGKMDGFFIMYHRRTGKYHVMDL